MGAGAARRLCPQAIVVEPRWDAYVQASRATFEVFEHTSPFVEKLSIDEAFLDVRGLERISGSPAAIAEKLRRDVREKVGLPITVGVARTRILAKMASGEAKPDGLLVVPVGGEIAFLHPLRVERVWGVGAATAAKLHDRGITTVGHIAQVPEPALVAILGRSAGRRLHALAHNRDLRWVRTRRGRRSFGAQSALGRASRSPEAIDAVIIGLVDRVTRRMRASGRAGRTVALRLRFGDFSRAMRSHTLPRATAATQTILVTLRNLLRAATPMIHDRGLTLVGVTVTNLDGDHGTAQLVLPFDDDGSALDIAVDQVRSRFGTHALTRAVQLGSGAGERRGGPPAT